jgi:peptidoglycan/xylan/chitin deacetylase (PgdA/CDA1 family)
VSIAIACLAATLPGTAVFAEGTGWAPALCWSAEALAARPGEREPSRGNHRFDRAEPERPLAPYEPIPQGLRGAIRRVELPPGRKLVALTLDLCEQPGEVAGYDGAIIDYLRANGIKATFFAGGKWLRSHDERARQLIASPLFEIGNHAWAHRNLRLLAGADLVREITAPQRAYETIRGDLTNTQCAAGEPTTRASPPVRMGLFRFPYGACNAAALAGVNEAGLLAIQWDVSTGDPSPSQSAQAIAQQMLRATRPGSIIIAHANGRDYHTAAALPLAIPRLRAMGYEFVTVSELLAAGRPVVASTCYDSRPGDTDRYDRPLQVSRAPARSGTAP